MDGVLFSTETHHIIARSRGGTDDEFNLRELSVYEHAEQHAIDFVLFEHAPQFDYRMDGWRLLPKDLQDAVKKEQSRRLKEDNPSHYSEVLEKKKKTFELNQSHNFMTPEGRERNRQRMVEMNKELNAQRNKDKKRREATSRRNKLLKTGTRHSPETREKMRQAHLARWAKIKGEL
jgi:hypothetical protein